jgi:ParB family transcriptional regulator, chromosome partitioning protein
MRHEHGFAGQLYSMKTVDTKPRTIPIDDVLVGSRIRRDLGNIDELASIIDEVGLLHPIVIRADGTLIAGQRRLAACKKLGWENILVRVVDLEQIARGEFAENAYRKGFLPSEIDAIRRELEPVEKAAAEQRQKATRFGSGGGKFPPPTRGKTRDKVAAFGGISGRTLDNISAVMKAAEADPQFIPFIEKMDRTGRVNNIYRQLRTAQQAERLRQEPPPLPRAGPYRVITADPAWSFDARSDDPAHRGTPYPTMTTAEIAALPVGDYSPYRLCAVAVDY